MFYYFIYIVFILDETTNVLPNIFDVAKEKTPVESCTGIKHNNRNEGSISYLDFKMLENFLEKTIEPNNFQMNEFNNSSISGLK